MLQRTLLRSTVLTLVVAASVALIGCHKENSGQKLDFAATVKGTDPLAYYRFEAINGGSETGSTFYVSQAGVTSSAAGAPIGMDGNKCVELNGKDGWIKSSLMGRPKTAGSIMVWVKLSTLPQNALQWFYVAGESDSANDFDIEFADNNELRFYSASGQYSTYMPNSGTLVGEWHMIVATIDYDSGSRGDFLGWPAGGDRS